MTAKLAEAVGLLLSNLVLFSLITLTLSVPTNLLVNFVEHSALTEAQQFFASLQIIISIDAVVGPICIGAMIYALAQIKRGRDVTYFEAIFVGLRSWGRLFPARILSGLLILLGFICLVVPGIILSLRFALLESVVILEGAGVGESMKRSSRLTQGIKLQILGTAVIWFLGFMALTILIYLPLDFVAELNTMPVEVVLYCIMDVVYLVIPIAIFLFYWEAREKEQGTGDVTADAMPQWDETSDMMARLEERPDDDNPYRPPQF